MVTPREATGSLPPQALLRQRYRILGVVGRGGMGTVYQALDTQAQGRRVAVKEMSQTHLREAEYAAAGARFFAEAALLGRLAHPALPRVYEAFGEQGRLYLVMDWIPGKTLFQLLQERGGQPLPVGEVLAYADQLCSVLAYLHQQQPPIIFRDLKPANVMVTAQGQVFLIDFGIARLFKVGQPQDTLLLGSPGYASPEQHGLAQTNPRSDLYGLGATLYACLTARDPSGAGNRFFFPPMRQSNVQVPEDLDHLIQRLVALDERQRPGSALEVQQALRQIRQQSVAPTERLSPAPQDVPPAARGGMPLPLSPALGAGGAPAPAVASAQAIPSPLPVQSLPPPPSVSLWTPAFLTVFGGLLALSMGSSVLAFNVLAGSDHLVEGSLALLLLLALLSSALVTRIPVAWSILGLAGPATLVTGFAFFGQAVLLPISPAAEASTATLFQPSTLNQLFTVGLAGAALVSMLWLARPFPGRARLTLLVLFGVPLLCVLLQYPAADGEVSKHLLLLISLITLSQGVVLATRLAQLQQRKRDGR
jgi:serine/threonine protein kinase